MKGDGESAPGGTSAVRVRLLGGFSLAVDGRPVANGTWRLRKARTLVKLLALAPGHRLHREQVIELLWPDLASDAAANNLHQALHVARRQLGGQSDRWRLRLENDTLTLGGETGPWIDVEAFQSEGGAALRSGDARLARAALDLYGGPLLPEDLYEAWTEPHRAELEVLHERLLALTGAAVAPDDGVQASRGDNLPFELTMFIGREAAIADVVRLLRRGALVTLSGPAGAGKTRLALEVAARQREGFRDGVWFVDLAALARPELIADSIAAATGLTQSGRSLSAAVLVDWLAGRELLIVLDNCEHVIAGCAETVEQVLRGCPAIQVLATSREPLALTGELVWRVPSLTLPDATRLLSPGELLGYESVRLFVERARAVQPRFALNEDNAEAVVQICRRLDGMPLAIELAAARAGSLPPAEIARRLVASFGLLRLQRRTVQTRQQTLEAALDWSYRLLEASEARLLGRLGVFAGSFGLEGAEQVCSDRGLPREEIVDLLGHLVDKSLVAASEDAGESRYRLLEMIRQYAREQLAEQEESAALQERHARWYAELAQDPGVRAQGRRLRLHRLDRDQADVRAALRWLQDHDPATALRLATALGDWWLLRGRFAEGQEWLLGAVARTPPSTPVAAAALLTAAPLALRGGDPHGGNRLAERSAEIYGAHGDWGGVAAALHLRASHDWLRGRFADAHEWLEQAVAAAQRAPLPGPEANATHGLAVLELAARRLPRARALLEQTLALLARASPDASPDFLVVNLGYVPVLDGDGRVQRLAQEESQNTFRRVDSSRARAYAQANLAVVARLEGHPDEAEAILGDALAQLRAVDDEAGIAQLLAATGRLATLQSELGRARAALRESLAIRRRLGDVRSVSLSLVLLAELAAAEGDGVRQRGLLLRALAMVEEVGDRPATTWTLLALAQAERAAGDAERARPRLEAALALGEALGSRLFRGWVLVDLSELERGRGASALAARLLDEARRAFAEAGDPWGLERCELLAAERMATLSER